MSQEKELVKNTTIYAIGNMGSKILAYIMVLVYSHYISKSDLGYYDLILTTVSLLCPIITMQVSDGAFRYIIDGKANKNKVISSAFYFLCAGIFLTVALFFIFVVYKPVKYKYEIIIYVFSFIFFYFFHEIIRGLGESRKYALIGLIYSVIMLGLEIIGILFFRLGVLALIWANNIALIFGIVIMIIWQKDIRQIKFCYFDKNVLKELLLYSMPLVPNTSCWWIVNSSDRYIILFFLGASFNGIYSISNKFPTILTTITGIFYLAWQESAIKEYYSPNRDEFFSKIFKQYYRLLFTLTICAIPFTQFVVKVFVGVEYETAWIYSEFLYLGATFSALSSFLGMGYQISKETRRSIISTILAAFINVGVNVLFIKSIGLYAASLSTFIAYFLLFIIRTKHCKKYFTLNVNWKEFYLLFLFIFVIMILTNILNNIWCSLLLGMTGVFITILYNLALFKPILKKINK